MIRMRLKQRALVHRSITTKRLFFGEGGQSTLEYAIIIAIVAAACAAMTTYLHRAVQANLNIIEDNVNVRAEADE